MLLLPSHCHQKLEAECDPSVPGVWATRSPSLTAHIKIGHDITWKLDNTSLPDCKRSIDSSWEGLQVEIKNFNVDNIK